MNQIVTARAPRLSSRVQGRIDQLFLPLLRANVLGRRMDMLEGLHPHDAPRGHAAGHDPDKVLIVGSGPAFGWGVTSHDLALCGAVARATSAMTGRGCDVEVLAQADFVARQGRALIGTRRLDDFDAVIFTLGVKDAVRGTSPASWSSSITELIQLALSSTSAATDVFFVGAPPVRSIPIYDTFLGGVAERLGSVLNQITEQLCASEERVFSIELPGQDPALSACDHYRTPAQYDAWAATICGTVSQHLNAQLTIDGDRRKSRVQVDEILRQRAVDDLLGLDVAGNATLKELVQVAQQAFRVETAQFSIIDDQRQIPLLSSGGHGIDVSRQHSFCAIAMQQREPLVVRDASADERFQNNPQVTGEPHVRFYAGIPITSPSGERIGALCVTDSTPRLRSDDINLAVLRELCVLVEKELWKVLALDSTTRVTPRTGELRSPESPEIVAAEDLPDLVEEKVDTRARQRGGMARSTLHGGGAAH